MTMGMHAYFKSLTDLEKIYRCHGEVQVRGAFGGGAFIQGDEDCAVLGDR